MEFWVKLVVFRPLGGFVGLVNKKTAWWAGVVPTSRIWRGGSPPSHKAMADKVGGEE